MVAGEGPDQQKGLTVASRCSGAGTLRVLALLGLVALYQPVDFQAPLE